MLVARAVAVVVVGVLLAVVGPSLRHPSDVETVLAVRFQQHYDLRLDALRCSIVKKPATYGCEGVAKGFGIAGGLPLHLEVVAPAADPNF
jgi:hypothetical protein